MDLEKALSVFHIDTLDQLVDLGESGIKTLYKKMAKDTHPDHNNGQKDDFIQINSAYGILLDEVRDINAQLGKTSTDETEKKNDQMVDFFYSKTAKSQKSISSQTDIQKVQSVLYSIQMEVQRLTAEYQEESEKIKIEFEKKVAVVESDLKRAGRKAQEELMYEFQYQISKHKKIQEDLKIQFDAAALDIYASGLNEMQGVVG
jgi:DnaJ-class molecular chaperone